jgi:hypothetical protein
MRSRDVFLELLSPALAQARRARSLRPVDPSATALTRPEKTPIPVVLHASR